MNFGEMVALIADDLVDERLTNVQIQNAINQALRFYSRKTFYFNTIKSTIIIAPGLEYYDIAGLYFGAIPSTIVLSEIEVPEDAPIGTVVGILSVESDPASIANIADMFSIENIKFIPDGEDEGWRLIPAADAKVENSRVRSERGPLFYSYAQMQIRVHPVPTVAGVLNILSTYKYPRLVSDTDTSVFFDRADELIRQAAKRYIAYNVLHDNALGDRCAAMEAEEFASLRAETIAREPAELLEVPTDLIAIGGSYAGYDIVVDR